MGSGPGILVPTSVRVLLRRLIIRYLQTLLISSLCKQKFMIPLFTSNCNVISSSIYGGSKERHQLR
jgi:hypothetical protein